MKNLIFGSDVLKNCLEHCPVSSYTITEGSNRNNNYDTIDNYDNTLQYGLNSTLISLKVSLHTLYL